MANILNYFEKSVSFEAYYVFLLKNKCFDNMSVIKLLTKGGAVLGMMMVFGACGSGKQAFSMEDLQGEWTVVEVKGEAIPSDSEAFLGFNVADRQVPTPASEQR